MNTLQIKKYNVQGPRYTSYPTVPFWDEGLFKVEDWTNSVKRTFDETNKKEGISIYIHLPFCESLCTFCGCNKHITKRHEDVEDPYLEAVLKEWKMYVAIMGAKPYIKELHLGGGTPTFFSPENLKRLINGIFEDAYHAPEHEYSFEGHPNNTTKEHLQALFDVGFRRVSFGIQDYDPKVQKAINRVQPFEHVENVTRWAREIGYTSVGHDLIYGLPFQTLRSIIQTISNTAQLMPDRIAFYSYAHVPWLKNGQRGFDENDLPKDDVKLNLFLAGKSLLTGLGYVEVGMDHFSLEEDGLTKAMYGHSLHRNFMGYTALHTKLLLGLGVSAIGDSWYAFGQNVKTLKEYQTHIDANQLPIYRGHHLTEEDLVVRKHILNIMCKFETYWINQEDRLEGIGDILATLDEMKEEGLVEFLKGGIRVTEEGRPFVRNICMAFDKRLSRAKLDSPTFSKTI
jgi:oxygen-independent coproporphyrinogen-3 oxidase